MSEEKQLVSIGLPTFNRVNTLKRAIDSFLAQTYQNFELIISDNASTDGTEKICLDYAQKDNRVKYFRQKENIGQIGQHDFLMSKVNGNYFMLAADDDWWHPNFILKLRNALDKNPEFGIAMSSLRQVHEDGTLVNEIVYDNSNDVSRFNYSKIFNAILFKKPPAHFFIMGLYRIEILQKILWESPPKVLGSDKVLMYEASLFTRFYSLPEILWVRTSSYIPDAKRYTGEYGIIFRDRWAYVKHLKAALSRLFRSPNISMKTKLTLLPIKTIVLIYAYRKHLMRELFPPVFGVIKWLNKRKL